VKAAELLPTLRGVVTSEGAKEYPRPNEPGGRRAGAHRHSRFSCKLHHAPHLPLPRPPYGIRLIGTMSEAAVRRADADPVETVYEAYREFLTTLVCRKFNVPQDDALELIHEVFVSFLRCRNDIVNQRAWLIAAACNAARGYFRRRRDTAPATSVENLGYVSDVDVIVRVAEVLRRLPPRWRRVLELHYLEGHSTREIATILDTTPGYAEKLVHESLVRARAAAREAECT